MRFFNAWHTYPKWRPAKQLSIRHTHHTRHTHCIRMEQQHCGMVKPPSIRLTRHNLKSHCRNESDIWYTIFGLDFEFFVLFPIIMIRNQINPDLIYRLYGWNIMILRTRKVGNDVLQVILGKVCFCFFDPAYSMDSSRYF